MSVYAVDFETTYQKGVRDIVSMGAHNYLRHPETRIYLVSMYGPGVLYAGPVEQAPWDLIDRHVWLSHNRTFDSEVYDVARERGQIPSACLGPKAWHCTADQSANAQCPRSLKDSSKVVLNREMSKDVRDQMSGAELTPAFLEECKAYALTDAITCHDLFEELPKLSELETKASQHTTLMCRRGVGVDRAKLAAAIERAKQELFSAQSLVPWFGELDAKGKEIPITSPKALARACASAGIPAPESTAKNDPGFDEWCERYGDSAPFVAAVAKVRSANRLLTVLEAMEARRDGDRLYYGLKYAGAQHTLRWSGDSGLNMQNLPRKEMFGVDVRSLIVPKPGYAFVSADYSQIEARVLPWIAGDTKLIALLAQGMDIYEAHARATMGYTDPRPLKEGNPEMRQMSKIRVLGLGFMMGYTTLMHFAKTSAGVTIPPLEAKAVVDNFRQQNVPITSLWARLGGAMRRAMIQEPGSTFETKLPSGRTIKYFNVHEDGGMRAQKVKGAPADYWSSGRITENLVQGIARDILAHAVVNLEAAGIPVVLHVHDEVLCEVPLDQAAEACQEVKRIMETLPEWANGLPLKSDAKLLSGGYTK